MDTGRKRSLPLTARVLTIDAARRKLGGRVASGRGQGRLVAVAGVLGVVLFASERALDVWTEGGVVRRMRPDAATPFVGEIPDAVLRVAADIEVFATLAEGQRVRFEASHGAMIEGQLVEKCRYGALVLAGDGKIVAVGFRKLWPVTSPSDPPS